MNALTSILLTDLYQLTMLQGYLEKGMHDRAVFEFSIRSLPDHRGFFVAAGLESVLDFLEQLHLTGEERHYLIDSGRFSRRLIDFLTDLTFTGDVDALPEGTICFPGEPIIRISAPLPEAQLIESRLINLIHFQTLIASKAARCTLAAANRARLVDFGLRRAHGAEAGLFAARSSYIAGFSGTATVMAEPLYGIPIFGTMAHSFIEAQESETEAFVTFAETNPGNVTLLIDTYDTCAGAEKVVEAASRLSKKGIRVDAVRLDSGDLAGLSRQVRTILDRGGLKDVRIFVSGNMDEYSIKDLLDQGAPIDAFGVGTKLDTSDDAPYFDCAYKLMEYAGIPRLKKSEGKATLPGAKQVFREFDGNTMVRDLLSLASELQTGRPLVKTYMEKGRRTKEKMNTEDVRGYTLNQFGMLPPHMRDLATATPYPVVISEDLKALRARVEESLP